MYGNENVYFFVALNNENFRYQRYRYRFNTAFDENYRIKNQNELWKYITKFFWKLSIQGMVLG